jgi:protein-tyrosine phosphatase
MECRRRRPSRRGPGHIMNCRDLGGLAASGGSTQFGRLYRSGSWGQLSEGAAAEVMAWANLAFFVDLRTPEEIGRDGQSAARELPGVRIVYLPIRTAINEARTKVRPQARDYGSSYIAMLPGVLGDVARIVRLFMQGGGRPLMFGCSAGKDRTGVISALVLRLAGVARREVSKDYALSARMLRSDLDLNEKAWLRKGLTRADYAARLECRRDAMDMFLAVLSERYSSAEALRSAVGLDPVEYARFLDAFVSSRSLSDIYLRRAR